MGRDVPAIVVSQADRRRYREKVRSCLDVLARMLRESRFTDGQEQVGLEVEFNLVDEAGTPSMRNAAVLAAIDDPDWSPELGRFNIEVNMAPRLLAGDAQVDFQGSGVQAAARAKILSSPSLMKNADAAPGNREWFTYISTKVAPLTNLNCP